ncbi:MAG: alpha/beta fold hydrolase [Brooklawnia sp.]|nr:alpha/beta fold hydrolase [Brooklawnia sp.]
MATVHQASRRRRWVRRSAAVVVCALAAAQVVGWFTATPKVGHFRSAADRAAYADAYQRALALMPVPTRTLDLQTTFGSVRAYQWENPDATGAPVVLLPGRGSGVPMWSENLPSLLTHRTIYALDAIGDAGMSSQSVPVTGASDQAVWIDEALAGLQLEHAHVVGHSFGAASAAALAVNRPQRVATLTLLEPAFVLGWPPLGTLAWSVPASLPFLPRSWRNAAIARIAGEDPGQIDPNDPVAAMITLGGTAYSSQLPTPRPLSDDQLRGLTMPVYVALADASTITRGAASLTKTALIGDVTTRVWPKTTHSLPMQVAEPLAKDLGEFWTANDG